MRSGVILAGISLSLFFAVLYLFQPKFVKALDYKIYDAYLTHRDQADSSSAETVLITIDDASLKQYGQWPWPRQQVAALVAKLHEAGAHTIAFDIIFAEAERNARRDSEHRSAVATPAGKALAPSGSQSDAVLAKTLAQGKSILGYKFLFADNPPSDNQCNIHPLNAGIGESSVKAGAYAPIPHEASGVTCNISAFSSIAAGSGFVNVRPDFDGVLRRIPLIMRYQNQFYPSLALTAYTHAHGFPGISLQTGGRGLEAVILPDTIIPVDLQGYMLINFPFRQKAVPLHSAADVMSGTLAGNQLADKIVIVGVSATGVTDLHTTPGGSLLSGAEVLAASIATIAGKKYLVRPDWVYAVEIILIIGLGIVSSILIARTASAVVLLGIVVAFSLGAWSVSEWFFHSKGIFISPFFPIVTLVSNLSFLTLLKFWVKSQEVKAFAGELEIKNTLLAEEVAERKLAEEKYVRLFALSPDSICLTDSAGTTIYEVNDTFVQRFGYSRDELTCATTAFSDLWAFPHDGKHFIHRLNIENACHGYETQLKAKDGEIVDVNCSGRVLELGAEKLILSVFRDITAQKNAERETKKLEEQLLQAQKMEAVGRLAGGVAHDYNNMLAVIFIAVDFIKRSLQEDDPILKHVLAIENTAMRSRDVTRKLLAFSRKQMIAPLPTDLNALIAESGQMLVRLIGEDIELVFSLAPDLPPVLIDPSQLDQILLNLAVNARDAMPNGGKLSIETAGVTLDETYCSQHPGCIAGPYISLTVSDNGIGMDKETMKNMFEPFFTTKEVGKGTGLGLAMVFGIVQQNSGFIEVYSELGVGTACKIFFPPMRERVVERKVPESTELPTGKEHILLVEDDEMLCRVTKQTLETLGYCVTAAGSPPEALALVEREKQTFDLLLTDVVMPAMNGAQLRDRIAQIRPIPKVLFMSGYTSDAIVHRGVLDEGIAFIQKPFSVRALAQKIRSILDTSHT